MDASQNLSAKNTADNAKQKLWEMKIWKAFPWMKLTFLLFYEFVNHELGNFCVAQF